MIAKLFEVHDEGTFIVVLAIQCNPADEAERYLLGRCGYGREAKTQARYVLLTRAAGNGSAIHYSPGRWGGRTMPVAHQYIIDHFEHLEPGTVVDVEFILGERPEPKQSERMLEAVR